MIRRIVAGLDGSDSGRTAGKYAACLAAGLGAEAEALSITDVRPLESPMMRDFTAHLGLEPYETYTEILRKSLESRTRGIIEQFLTDAKEIGLPEENTSTHTEVGLVIDILCERAKLADLIVIGQYGENLGFSRGFLGSTSEQLVRRAARPVMVCPPSHAPVKRPLIAYDGSTMSDDALRLGCDFASQMDCDLTVLIVADGDQMNAESAENVRERARSYLCCAHVDSEIEIAEGDPEQEIIAHAVQNDHGMIIMGAFGHGRIRKLVIGSTTVHVMRNSTVPVMLTRH
jgi:nucleotide-binding universal stress UspA family protein